MDGSPQTDKECLLQRIKDRVEQKDNVSEANQTVLENQLNTMQRLSEEEQKYSITIDTTKKKDLLKLWTFINEHSLSCQPK